MIGRVTQTLAATAVGLTLLWYSGRQLSIEQIVQTVSGAELLWISLALFAYWFSLGIRTRRWFGFLAGEDKVRMGTVGKALIAGYAANNVLPARLGEFVRADYAKRITAVSRSTLLGSIGLERICDGLVVVGFLISGLALNMSHVEGNAHQALLWTAGAGSILFGAAVTVVALLTWQLRNGPPHWFGRLARIARDFLQGVARASHAGIMKTVVLSLVIWSLEAFALCCILQSIGIEPTLAQALVFTGAASLSTLIPTAPGYIGTYQMAFYLSAEMFGLDTARCVIGATLTQIFLFGSVVLVGGVMLVIDRKKYLGRLAHTS